MVKKIFKTSYWTIFVIILFMVVIKFLTPKPLPVRQAKMPDIVTYHAKQKTYVNSNLGTYQYIGHTTDRGTFYLNKKKANQKIVIIKFKFKNTSDHSIKPYTDLKHKLIIKQGKKQLPTGNLHLSNKRSQLVTQTNNAVRIFDAGEQAKIALPYIYIDNGKTIKVYLDNHLLSKFR